MIFTLFTKVGPSFCYESDEPIPQPPILFLEENRADFTLTFTPNSSKWSHSFRFYHNSVSIYRLVYTCHNPCPSLPRY